MPTTTNYMDYTVSTKPIRIIDRKVGRSLLDLASLSIVNVGHLPGRTLFRSRARFQYWAVVYIADGSGTYRIDGGEIQPIRGGSLFFFYPGASFDYGPDKGGTWDEYYFTIEGTRIGEWLGSWLRETDKVRQVGPLDIYAQRIERIFRLMDSSVPGDPDRAALQLEALLFEFVLEARSLLEPNRAGAAEKLLEELNQSVYERFDAESFCERHHISLSTLRRLVRKSSGYPLNEHMHRLKIAEAKNRLLNTSDSVKEIADLLGYSDVFYFSRLFKKFTGVSPREYRKTV